MKKIFITTILLCVLAFGFSQENIEKKFSESFMESYISISIENEKEIDKDKYLKLVEKEKLNQDIVFQLYSENFKPSEVDASVNALLLAFVLENETLKKEKHYLNKENNIATNASKIYMEKWQVFSKDKKQSENLFLSFIEAEQKRLLTIGVDVKVLQKYF